MATGLVAILFLYAPSVVQPVSAASIKPILFIVFVLTYVVPLISIGMLKLTSSISSMKLSDRRERLMPFLFVTVYYALTTYLFANKVVLGNTLIVIFSTITFIIFLVTVITKFYKISAHSAGAWGMVGFMFGLHFKYPDSQLFMPILITIVLAGIINAARLSLNEHNLTEIFWGSIMGLLVSFSAIILLT